ncbi:hypothetical protein SLA2020_257050 [Shorea laevis]
MSSDMSFHVPDVEEIDPFTQSIKRIKENISSGCVTKTLMADVAIAEVSMYGNILQLPDPTRVFTSKGPLSYRDKVLIKEKLAMRTLMLMTG